MSTPPATPADVSALPHPDVIPRAVMRQLLGGGDWLSSWWSVVAAGVVAVGLVVLAVVRHRRGRRGWPWVALSTLTTLFGLALTANVIAGYVPNTLALRVSLASWGVGEAPGLKHGTAQERAGGTDQGSATAVNVPAPADLKMPTDSLTWVYTPPGYDPAGTTRYPVVYLVHGSPGASGDWFAAGNAAQAMDVLIRTGKVQPMIVVAPDVNGTGPSPRDTECLDSTTGGSQVDTYLADVLVPWVDAHYRTAADRAGRAFGGFSSGGYCALDHGLRHADQFGTILSMGPYADPGEGGHAMLATQAEWDEHDVMKYASTIELPSPLTLFLSVPAGENSMSVRHAADVATKLAARGVDVVWREEPGQTHTWTMARATLPYALVTASQHLTAG
ncbi:esterase family protein [Cellulomonas sp. B6]|uniref:alpha/beta hydrolase n=1 Tax=Cellulomonas sp. B6 TaxID=1295626 RepID=UPI00073C27A8|nr:alpha/beta hydrolase-fold protein [Cellulomonas sp. B6]KSW28924.1 hypothetical protein ATM99_10430 [Cellulomonas sp. B6]